MRKRSEGKWYALDFWVGIPDEFNIGITIGPCTFGNSRGRYQGYLIVLNLLVMCAELEVHLKETKEYE